MSQKFSLPAKISYPSYIIYTETEYHYVLIHYFFQMEKHENAPRKMKDKNVSPAFATFGNLLHSVII